MKEYKLQFDRGYRKMANPAMTKYDKDRIILVKNLIREPDIATRNVLIKKIKSVEKERLKITSRNEMDNSYKRIEYIRYADDFIVGISGSKEDSICIKENIKKNFFMKN